MLPFEGCNAAWGNEKAVFFLRGANSLWRYQIGDQEPTRLLIVHGSTNDGYVEAPQLTGKSWFPWEWAKAPLLSQDKSWLAWGWARGTRTEPKKGTVLVDLENEDYRVLKGYVIEEFEGGLRIARGSWWASVQWIK